MALSSETKEGPNYGEVLHKTDSSNSKSNYSGDSLESNSDGSDGRYKSDFDSITDEGSEKYQNDSFESFADESSRRQRTDSFVPITNDSSRSYEGDSFESLDSELEGHQTYSSESLSIESASVEDERQKKKQVAHKKSSGKESKALQSYCSLKIEHLRQPPKSHRQKPDQALTHPSKAISVPQSCHIPQELMNRLELQCFKETINQVNTAEMHDPTACPDCLRKQAELAQCHFIRRKKSQLEADLLHKKMEEYTYSKDLVTCIGEILQSLPKPTEEQSAIWQKLNTSVMKK